MYDSIQEVAENKFLSNLITLANCHRLYGVYVKYTKAKNPEYNGMYFLVSLSANNVIDKNLNIEELFRKQCSSMVFDMNLHITRITNQSPLKSTLYTRCFYNYLITNTILFIKIEQFFHSYVNSSIS